jgi:transcriptional regulator with XRE-family HTH domain
MTAGEKPPPIGAAGRNVAANVERLRHERGLSLCQLSGRLAELGRPILPSVLHRVVHAERRTGADDLAGLAAALGVAPADLLMPPGEISVPPVQDHPAIRAARTVTARIEGVVTISPGAGPDHAARSLKRALRRFRLEVDELLENTPRQGGGELADGANAQH